MSAAGLSWSSAAPGDTRPRWAAALVVVVGLHGAAAAGMLTYHVPLIRPAATEAVLIDLSPAPPAEEPAAEPEEANAAPPPPQYEEPPPPEPPPPEVEPEVALPAPPPPPPAPPQPRRPPRPRPPQAQPVQNQAPPSEAPAAPAPVAAAPSPGTAPVQRGGGGGIVSWQGRLMARLQSQRRYPELSRSRREEGVVHLSFAMDRDGNVLSARIARSSGYPALDQETLDLARRASPLPPPPEEIPGSPLNLTVPVRFSLR